ncbi:SDR family oxidoreductase [Caballeronia sp. LjRoot34]|uniref:SDR family oxidoreductase n=1 Tax=Caballeronia sp. LjRoot34 TaxID=3342325 RepID=UPI003ED11409
MKDIFAPNLLQGKHAFITGAGSGINKRIAEKFAEHGAHVSIVGRNIEKSVGAAADIVATGGSAKGFSADVRSFEALSMAVTAACTEFGPIDICIAGAAGNFVAEAKDMSANGFRTVIEIDLLGTYNTFRSVYSNLRSVGADLLAISAVQSVMPTAAQAHVCAAKAGVDMLVRTLSIEWGAQGIRCNAIAPGPVEDTEGMKRLAPEGQSSWDRLLAGIPLVRAASRDEVADLALFLVSGASRYINGTVVAIDGGQSNTGSLPMGNMLVDSLRRDKAGA